jgi:EpsI family protein
MNHLKFIILIGILSLMALFYIFGESSEVEGQIDKEALAPEIKGWSFVNDIEVDYKIYSALDPNTLIFRNYANNHNQLVNLVVVYHQNDRWGAHDPTVCYRSQGWQIVEKPHDIRISNGKLDVAVKRFVVTKGQVSSLVYYCWFSSKKKLTPSRNLQMLDMVLNGLIHGYTESGFLRFSTTLDTLNQSATIRYLNDFTLSYIEGFSNQDS